MASEPKPFKDIDPEAVGREKTVAKEPAVSFDERTAGARPLWQNEDGSQNTGAEDVAEEPAKEK